MTNLIWLDMMLGKLPPPTPGVGVCPQPRTRIIIYSIIGTNKVDFAFLVVCYFSNDLQSSSLSNLSSGTVEVVAPQGEAARVGAHS